MARYHGKSGMVYISTSGTAAIALVASLSDWSLDMSTDTVETTSFGDSNKTYVQGLKDVAGSFSGFYDNADESIFTAADSTDGCKVYLYPSSAASTKYFYGPAWLSASVSSSVSDAVKVSGAFKANGAWGRK